LPGAPVRAQVRYAHPDDSPIPVCLYLGVLVVESLSGTLRSLCLCVHLRPAITQSGRNHTPPCTGAALHTVPFRAVDAVDHRYTPELGDGGQTSTTMKVCRWPVGPPFTSADAAGDRLHPGAAPALDTMVQRRGAAGFGRRLLRPSSPAALCARNTAKAQHHGLPAAAPRTSVYWFD